MREMLLALCIILCLTACEKETNNDLLPEEQEFQEDDPEFRRRKVKVCHNGHIIRVNRNAVAAHQAHGDAIDWDRDGYFDMENVCADGVDCDDHNRFVNPDCLEVCDNLLDDDCDGDTDEMDDDCAVSCVDGEIELSIDPDGTPDTGDEYTLYVHPAEDNTNVPWGEFSPTGATSNWDGAANTDAIVNMMGAGTTYAAGLCADLATDECNWYLPSIGELEAMYAQLGPTNSGGNNEIQSGVFWSSTEVSVILALGQNFEGGEQSLDLKDVNVLCRCVRRGDNNN